MMRIGYALGNMGPIGTANSVIRIAPRAEELSYDNFWTVERLLGAVNPQTPYPVTHEVFYDPAFTPGAQNLDRWLQLLEQLRKVSA